jgi:hypothetical protein
MKKALTCLLVLLLTLMASPAMSEVVDISGPWFIDFPQGRGMVVLQKGKGNPPVYSGMVTLPYPNSSTGFRFPVGLLSGPSYVVPGNNITFRVGNTAMIQFFMMNVSSSSSGIAWIVPSTGANKHIRSFYNVQAPAHR